MADRTRNGAGPIGTLFRDELRNARTQAGLTQEELAVRVSFSPALVAAIETGRRSPSADFSRQCDDALGTNGLFGRMQARLAEEAGPTWLREWAEMEREAVVLRWWETLLVPGLLQTPEYARVILASAPGATDEETAARLGQRLERQAILDRGNPPMLFAVIDEGVLRRDIGGPGVMRGQLGKLLEMAGRAKVSLQVVPASAGSHPGLVGPFIVADFQSAPAVANVDTALISQLVERPQDVAEMRILFDMVRGAALPCRASAELIEEVMGSWT
jgi:transcriptional regulator with XRE-family HTH domain